jgi:hypothetical protein
MAEQTLQTEVHEAHAAARKAQLLAAAYQLDNAGLHGIDVTANEEARLPAAGTLGRVRKARIAVQTTMWPDNLKEQAEGLVHHLMELESGLRDESLESIKGPAKESHDVAHGLADGAYAWLGESAPAHAEHEAMGGDHDTEHQH